MSLENSRARAVADVTNGMLLAAVEIAAPPDRVFRSLASDELVKWWGAADVYRTTKWTGEVKVGGSWRTEGVSPNGQPFAVGGEFLEVDPPKKLVQTWKPDWDAGHTTVITYRLEPIPGGTRLTVRHEGFAGRPAACSEHTEGWERVLTWLHDYFEKSARPQIETRA